jgi:hypothetical protein
MATGFKISGVDVYDMKTLSGVEVVSDWEVVKEFDFTKAPDHTFADGVAQAFEGVNWTCRNLSTYGGADSYIKFIEGTGLQMLVTGSSAASAHFYWRTQTSPLLQASVSSIDSNYDDEDTICFQVLLSSSFSNLVESSPYSNYPLSQLIISDGDYGDTQDALWATIRAFLIPSAAPPRVAGMDIRVGGSTVHTTAGETSDDVTTGSGSARWPRCMEIVATPASGYIISAAHTSSAGKVIDNFPRPMSMTTIRSSATMEWQIQSNVTNNPGVSPTWPLKASNMVVNLATAILLWAGADPVGPIKCGITTTFTKLRVLKRIPHG